MAGQTRQEQRRAEAAKRYSTTCGECGATAASGATIFSFAGGAECRACMLEGRAAATTGTGARWGAELAATSAARERWRRRRRIGRRRRRAQAAA